MVLFAQSRCKWAVLGSNANIVNTTSALAQKTKSRKTLQLISHVDPIDKLPSVEREKLLQIREYKVALGKVVATARNKYISNLTNLVVQAVQQTSAIDVSLKESVALHSNSFILTFAVRVPPTISDASLAYSQIYRQLQNCCEKSDSTVVRLRTLHTETLQLLFSEIAKNISKDTDDNLPVCSFELLLKLLKIRCSVASKLILLFENAEQVPIGVLSTAMQLFGQCFSVGGIRPVFILGVSSAESWHKLHSSLPLRACKNASFCFLSAGASAVSPDRKDVHSDADVDFVENVIQELLLSERFPLKFGPLCASEILTWLRDGRLSIANVEQLFHFIAQYQLYKLMAEEGEYIIKLLPGSTKFDECTTASSRQRNGDVNVRSCLSRLRTYWIDVKAACLVLRQIEESVLISSFQSANARTSILEIYRMTLDSNIAETRWCNRLLNGTGTLSEDDVDKLLSKIITTLNTLKEQTGTLDMAEDQRPNFLRLLDICIDLRHQYEIQRIEKTEGAKKPKPVLPLPSAQAFSTPSVLKTGVERRKTMMGLFGTPQTSSVSYFEHQARLRAEIKANKGTEEDSSRQQSTPGGSLKFGTRQFTNQIRDWLFEWVPNKSKIVSGEQSAVFFFDDLWHLANSFNPDMNELLSAGLSSKSIRQHLTVKVPSQSDFDVHVFFSVFTSSSSAGSIPTTAPLSQWYAAFSEARRLRRRKSDAPIDDKEMQARFVSALDELETRGLLRYNPPRRTITKLFECEEDDEL